MSEGTYFNIFCNKLKISSNTRSIISTRYNNICQRLNKDFWDMDTTTGGRYVGSYGRETANNWVSDIDMVFEMPCSLKVKYDAHIYNGQSAFLQAVKTSIGNTYHSSSLGADGQIVKVSFSDKIDFEILPVFKNPDDSYTYADTNNGGSWKKTNPVPEIEAVKRRDKFTNCNLKRLCRMVRAWQYFNSVPMSGLLIDTLAYRFIFDWAHKNESYFYYDLLSRDFFKYLSEQNGKQAYWFAPGSLQKVYTKGDFTYKAKLAYKKACEAISNQRNKYEYTAKKKWREIYGYRFPE